MNPPAVASGSELKREGNSPGLLRPPRDRGLTPVAPRILIMSASVGTGHLRAAEAVQLALGQLAPRAYVQSADVMTMATAPFRRCYADMYLDLVRLAPQFIGYVYNLMDRPGPSRHPYLCRLRVFLEKLNLRPFVDLLKSQPWDLIINTFFLPAEVVASLKAAGEVSAPQVMVTTDFETHRNWAAPGCERYFTATEEAALYLQSFGIPRSLASATGIPIHPIFSMVKERAACLARQGLVGDRPVVLLLAGGDGAVPIQEPYMALLEVDVPLEIVVVTGHNALAKEQLGALPPPARHRVKVLGFTRQMDELLAAADLVVTKPGGLTVSEVLARGAGLVIVNPIPGQEERNSDYLLENGAAIKVNHLPTLAHKVTTLLRDPDRLTEMRRNARRLARPRAAFDVAEQSLALLRQPCSRAG